ncbi:unnamed protein product [Acanthoscelides obtectus]|uniref:Uncharacterized protein n=1 Tax=Acanthoscelides obtectus TaxID=200917 RepID=A0A9P0QJW9_ACAOB|nr:unnamed protein product [Acanthoscelides obtectus]CAH2021780.1 unnamed protein product [Acanthoscelides obtectus]CAK1621087.1 hypothetical protein AOBTE_LOCUS757 [Acanthoscelides obtectus]CAK1686723.1 hypothetical protein AOBTE_LOCUS36039 [Acanthoscelides obtectus]
MLSYNLFYLVSQSFNSGTLFSSIHFITFFEVWHAAPSC